MLSRLALNASWLAQIASSRRISWKSLVVVDFAMTTIATRPRAALAALGGAATRYEQIKRDKYQTRADEMGAELVPVIVDDAGAWSESALPFWKRIIRRFANDSTSPCRRQVWW
jgi:hypothetical protein